MEARIPQLKIAVIGAGVAGITAAWALRERHQVTLFEKNDYLGGHTNTRILADSSGKQVAIDTGFIVCNRRNYPNFYRLLSKLGVELRDTEMSFGYRCESTGIGFVGPGLGEALRLPESLLSLDFIRLILEQWRFNRKALSDLESGLRIDSTLREYAEHSGCSKAFIQHYLIPISAAIWSSSDQAMLHFPARTFLTFFRNHGMLELSKRPQWQTVVGGSHAYVSAFKREFKGEIRTNAQVKAIRRDQRGITVISANGEERFDRAVLACHADEALQLLSDPSEMELRLLGDWRYHKNRTVLHSDASVMPPNRRNWGCWNYYRRSGSDPNAALSATYYMNRLQGLNTKTDYFVTLNNDQISPEKVHYETTYTHPEYTSSSLSSQAEIRKVNGTNHTYYCGSYMGYGFHEDAVTSALEAAELIGGAI